MNRYNLGCLLCLLGLLAVVMLSALNESRHWIGAQWFCLMGFWLGVGQSHLSHLDALHRIFRSNAAGKP